MKYSLMADEARRGQYCVASVRLLTCPKTHDVVNLFDAAYATLY